MSAAASVELKHISLRYSDGARPALDDVDLAVGPGETLVLLGASGCGKSTLLRCINRLLVPTQGSVAIDGVDIAQTDIIALRRTIGYVVQSNGLFPHLTVAQNVGFVPELIGWNATRIAKRVDALLTLVHLEPAMYRARRVSQLSGGEAQRIGVARALAAEPRILLMDEPFGALDPAVRRDLQSELHALIAELGTTTIFVTHDLDEALLLADRIAVMDAGRILRLATPLDLLRDPGDERVANLLGRDALLRKLVLVRISQAVQPGDASGLPAMDLDEQATLAQALQYFLLHPEITTFGVADVGRISFPDIARAVAHAEANE